MKKRLLGQTGINVTPIGFGVLTVGKTQLNLPIDQGAALLRYALERGINFFDTAQYYQTYPYIRKALKGSSYDPIIASKSLDSSYREMSNAIEEARRELDRDVIDIFLLHEVRNDPDWENRKGAWECLQEAKVKGLVRAIGVSTHHVDMAEKTAADPQVDILFPLINYKSLGIRKGNGFGTKEEMADAIKNAADRGQGVFAMKALGGGVLVPNYLEAMSYVINLTGISSIMLGFGNRNEVDRAIEFIEGTLDADYVPDLSNKKIWIDQGDCEGCGACLHRCPNHAIYLSEQGLANVKYELCLTCGYCAPVCPVRAIIMLG